MDRDSQARDGRNELQADGPPGSGAESQLQRRRVMHIAHRRTDDFDQDIGRSPISSERGPGELFSPGLPRLRRGTGSRRCLLDETYTGDTAHRSRDETPRSIAKQKVRDEWPRSQLNGIGEGVPEEGPGRAKRLNQDHTASGLCPWRRPQVIDDGGNHIGFRIAGFGVESKCGRCAVTADGAKQQDAAECECFRKGAWSHFARMARLADRINSAPWSN